MPRVHAYGDVGLGAMSAWWWGAERSRIFQALWRTGSFRWCCCFTYGRFKWIKHKSRLYYWYRSTGAVDNIIMLLLYHMSHDPIKSCSYLALESAGLRNTLLLLLQYSVIYSWEIALPQCIAENSAHSKGSLEKRKKKQKAIIMARIFRAVNGLWSCEANYLVSDTEQGFGCPLSLRCSERETSGFVLASG